MRFFAVFVFIVLTVFLGIELWNFRSKELEAKLEFQEINRRLEEAWRTRDQLQADYEYLSQPDNLEKELRRRNYRSADEKLIVVVPPSTSTATSGRP